MNLADSLNVYCTIGDLDRLSAVAKLYKNPLIERGSLLVITQYGSVSFALDPNPPTPLKRGL
jgi:hypothetical protein